MKGKRIFIASLALLLVISLFFTASAFACSNQSQEKDFYYCAYSQTPSVSWNFPLCNNGSYSNRATTWWYNYSTPNTQGWMLKYFDGTSANYSHYYSIKGYSVSYWTPGGWGQITNFNINIPPYATLDTGKLDLIVGDPFLHYGSGRNGDYYSVNFTTLTSDSSNYTIYQEVYPESW